MISKQRLRLLIESVLLESFKQDQRDLIKKYPTHAAELSRLQTKPIMWLADRFGKNPSRPEPADVTFEKALKAIMEYTSKDAAMGEKYRTNDWWRREVNAAFPGKEWSSPSDLMSMTTSDVLKLLKLSKLKRPRIPVDRSKPTDQYKVGEIGPWKIYEARDRESSCNIIGVKPGTDEPRADVCIARTDASNLFYNYAADYTLFTIIRGDDPTAPEDILIVGFKDDGTPEFNADPMRNPTVDGENRALKPQRLRQILGDDHDAVMSIMSDHIRSRVGPSPARQKIHSAAGSIEDFNEVLRGISQSEALSLKQAIATQDGISPEVQSQLLSDPSELVRQMLASNKGISTETMTQLAQDPSFSVRGAVVSNANVTPDILSFMAQNESDPTILGRIARSSRVQPDTLVQLIDNSDEGVRVWAASNPRTPVEALRKSARRGTPQVRRAIAQNRAGNLELLRYLADDPEEEVRRAVMNNPRTPDELSQQIRSGGTMAGLRQLIRRMI